MDHYQRGRFVTATKIDLTLHECIYTSLWCFSFFFFYQFNPSVWILERFSLVCCVCVSSNKWPHSGNTNRIKLMEAGYYFHFTKCSVTPHWFVWASVLRLYAFMDVSQGLCVRTCVCETCLFHLSPCICGKVKAGKALCLSGTWEVVAKVIGLFVYVSGLLENTIGSLAPWRIITNKYISR